MPEEIKALSEAMHKAAEEAFYAAERFGRGSAEHVSLYLAYKEAAGRYEAACKSAGIAAYATYNAD